MQQRRILITGASGFIGSFLVEEALNRGLDTWAAVRKSSSRRYLTDSRIHFIELDFNNPDDLRSKLEGMNFDYVIHAAGATKCLHKSDFFRVNTTGTANLAATVSATCPNLKRFVFMSSLSVVGPTRENTPYTDINASDTPRPNTAYGQSKLEAENALDAMKGFPFIILRPTGVYGPREKDYFMMAQSISRHVDFAAGLKPQDITFIYVKDLVQAAMLALDNGNVGSRYFLSDGNVYSSRAFSDLICHELGNPWLLRIKAPLWMLRAVTAAGECIGQLTGKITALNNDKYKIMKQRNWRCDITPAVNELGFKPRYDLEKGVHEAIEWYKENKWL